MKEALEHATPTGDLEVADTTEVESTEEESQVDSTDPVDTPAEVSEQ